jgi:hypothetical protein
VFRSILRSFHDLDYTNSGGAETRTKKPGLSNRHRKWDNFRRLVNERSTLNIPLKTEGDIEVAAKFFNYTIQWAGWNAMQEHKRTLRAAIALY